MVRVPPVELALIFNAYAARRRHAPNDITGLYNLLSIAFEYPVDEIGGWKIGTVPLFGKRLDAARILLAVADSARQSLIVINGRACEQAGCAHPGTRREADAGA